MSATDSDSNTTYYAEPSSKKCHSEEFYTAHNQSLKSLFLLCCGLKDDEDKPLFDINSAPWNGLPVSSFKPKAIDYKTEIARRATKVFDLKPVPRPNAWPNQKILKWLDDHPIVGDEDVAFITATFDSVKKDAIESVAAMATETELLGEKAWTGQVPYLRLIHCLIDNDDIKRAYHSRNDIPPGRLHLENRNSVDKQPKTVWQMLAEKWNDPLFAPETEELGDLHSDFVLTQHLTFMHVEHMATATPEKCHSKFSSMIVELTRIIGNWEKSGQGDGGILGEEPEEEDEDNEGAVLHRHEFGALDGRPQGALDQRHLFFKQGQSYLLYLWHMLDKHGLRGTAFQMLDDSVSAANGGAGVPSIIGFSRGGESNSIAASVSGTPQTGQYHNNSRSSDGVGGDADRISKLAESIESLSQKVLDAARVDAESRINLARMADKRDLELARMADKRDLMTKISTLRSEKRQLLRELSEQKHKKNKVMIDMVNEQLQDLSEETATMQKMLDAMSND